MKIQKIRFWVAALLSGLIILPIRAVAFSPSATTDGRCKQWVDSVYAQMTTLDKVGQLLVATIPARADKQNQRLARDLAKRYKIGGLIFDGGTSEEQAILTNVAQKNASVPLLIVSGGKRLASRLSDVPSFPELSALRCMDNEALMQAFEREEAREFIELGMYGDARPEAIGDDKLLEGMVVSWGNARREQAQLLKAVEAGELTEAELKARCCQVLTRKYLLGLRGKQAPLQISGLGIRVSSEAAQALATQLRQASVTVAHNYFSTLPLTSVEGGMAVLSIGEAGRDSVFVEALKKQTTVVHFRLDPHADKATAEAMRQQLLPFRRVVISLTGSGLSLAGPDVVDWLTNLDLQAPLVYAAFSPWLSLLPLEQALAQSNAFVLAHSAEADLQQYVADVLFAKASAHGRLAMNIGRAFPAGTGCDIEPGMKPAAFLPEELGMKSYVLQRIDALASKGVAEGAYPGCRILVLKDGKPLYDKGFGTHSARDTTAVRPTDMFDLSSLTQPLATVLAVMKLYDTGKLKLDDKISKYVTSLRTGDKRDITIRQLLLHESGLAPYIRFHMEAIDPNSVHGPYSQSWEDQWHKTRISEHSFYCSDFRFKRGLMSPTKTADCSLQVADGMWLSKKFKNTILQSIAKSDLGMRRSVQSDLGFILLQEAVEAVSGLPLDLYVAKEFYAPMGLQRTMFRPLGRYAASEIMPTAFNDYLRRQDLCGYVYDEAAACLGGVAGHAGLFSTAEEVGKVFQMLLNGGELNGKRYLSEATCRLFTSEVSVIGRRGLGFDKPDVAAARRGPCSASTPAVVYGQTGATGTCAWADPANRLVYVFLSNTQCPNAWNTKLIDMNIRKDIQELIYQSLKKADDAMANR